MKPLKYTLALAVLFACAPAFASGPVPSWDVVTDKSRLEFSGKESGKDFHGEFKKFDSKIVFDKANLAGSSIEITVDTASAITGDKVYDDALPGSDWFHTKAFPTAVFKSTSIKSLPKSADGKENYEADGVLNLIGGLQPITLTFTLQDLSPDGSSVRALGGVTLKRLDFKMGTAVDANGSSVSNDIPVKFDITAQKKSLK